MQVRVPSNDETRCSLDRLAAFRVWIGAVSLLLFGFFGSVSPDLQPSGEGHFFSAGDDLPFVPARPFEPDKKDDTEEEEEEEKKETEDRDGEESEDALADLVGFDLRAAGRLLAFDPVSSGPPRVRFDKYTHAPRGPPTA